VDSVHPRALESFARLLYDHDHNISEALRYLRRGVEAHPADSGLQAYLISTLLRHSSETIPDGVSTAVSFAQHAVAEVLFNNYFLACTPTREPRSQ
jgi:hypothetical protein